MARRTWKLEIYKLYNNKKGSSLRQFFNEELSFFIHEILRPDKLIPEFFSFATNQRDHPF